MIEEATAAEQLLLGNLAEEIEGWSCCERTLLPLTHEFARTRRVRIRTLSHHGGEGIEEHTSDHEGIEERTSDHERRGDTYPPDSFIRNGSLASPISTVILVL